MEKKYFLVRVLKYPENEDFMYCLEVEKRFPELSMALKCREIWKSQFNLDSEIISVYVCRNEIH